MSWITEEFNNHQTFMKFYFLLEKENDAKLYCNLKPYKQMIAIKPEGVTTPSFIALIWL